MCAFGTVNLILETHDDDESDWVWMVYTTVERLK